MKKTTSALAIAALLGTGAASAATFQVNDDATMSIGVGIYTAYVVTTDADGNESTTFGDNGSDIVFSGEHRNDNGLTTFATFDLDGFDSTDSGSDEGTVVDEASVGIRGEFGEIVIGSNAGVYDEYADFADGGGLGWTNLTSFSNADVSDVIQYSNGLGNLSYKLQAQVGDDNANGTSTVNTSSTSLGAGAELDLGAVSLSAAYEQRANTAADEPIYGIGATTNIGGASVTVGYEVDDNATNSVDKVSIAGSYPVGPVTLTAFVQNVSFDSVPGSGEDTISDDAQVEDSFTEVQIGALYSITDQMSASIETAMKDRENDEGDYIGIGLNYSF